MSSIIERVLFLKETPLFMEVEPSVLVHLAERLEPRQVAPGERLVQVGQRNEGIHIIQKGQVEVTQARDTGAVRITMLGPRDAVGELSVLNDMPATADCTAKGQVETYYVPQALLAQLLHQHPRLALGMIRVLSQRLMTTTQQVQRDAAPAASAPDGCIQM